ncbi:MAG: prefoldin subunit [Candidatus Pacearchaeota archaeon]
MTEVSFDNLSGETRKKIQQIQIYEQNFQQLLLEKQAISLEIEELENSLKDLEKYEGETFKIIAGQYIIKINREKILEEIANKKEVLSLRIKNLEKQEKDYVERMEDLQREIMNEINNTKI